MSGRRNIPATLMANLATRRATPTTITRIACSDGRVIGLTEHDRSFKYDDGDGEVSYQARHGYVPSSQVAGLNLSVDNAAMSALLAEYEADGLLEADLLAGRYDGAEFTTYLVDYEDLAAGHVVLEYGTIGKINTKDGLVALLDKRSLSQQMKQQGVCEKGSLTCRATHGDASTGCYADVSGDWQSGTVESVGAETTISFVCSTLTEPALGFNPFVVKFTGGDNAGRSYEGDSYDAGTGAITLAFETYKPIQVGDTFDIRDVCDLSKTQCIARGQILNMRAEPDRPVADSESLGAPKA